MGLRENLVREPVSRLTLRELVTVEPRALVRDVVALLRSKELGCAVVLDDGGRAIGWFTEEDLIHLIVKRPAALDGPVAEHLTPDPACVGRERPIAELVATMQARNLRFAVVTDEEGRAVALTGQKGLMEYVAEHFPEEVLTQRIGKPSMRNREGA